MIAAARAAAPTAPLSVAQEGIWYRARVTPALITYNEVISIRKDGPLDVTALRRALCEVVRRHEAWRTSFDVVEGQPVQVIAPPPAFALPVLDLGQLTAEQAERRATRVIADVASVPYDVRLGPLLRPRLIRCADDDHRLYLALHNLAFDGVSVYRVVLPELVALYNAFAAARPPPLPEPTTRYADYARWEQEWIGGQRAARRIDYWRRKLNDAPATELRGDRPRLAAPRSRGGALKVSVPTNTVDRLREIGHGLKASLFQVLAASWSALLGRYTGQDDVIFATPAQLRQRPEFESIVGYCVTPVVLRIDLQGAPSFADLVVRARNELLDGLDHLVPFERLVRELRPRGAGGANPVYQTMLVLEPPAATTDSAWSLRLMETEIRDLLANSRLDLELQLEERPEGNVAGRLIYDSDLFDRATAARIADQWLRLVAAAAAEPATSIWAFELLTPAQRDRQLVEWNATTIADEGPTPGAHESIAATAARRPDAPAVSDGVQAIDYSELDRRVAGAASRVDNARQVSLSGEPSIDSVVELLGALRAGAEFVTVDALGADGLAPVGPAAVQLARALGAELGIGPADTVVVLPSMMRSVPAASLVMPLAAGAHVILAPPEVARDGALLSRLIAAERVSLVHGTPSDWRSLIDTGFRSARGLRALCAPEPPSRELAGALLQRCSVLWSAYGVAQTSGYCTVGRIRPGEPVTIGRPLADTRVYVLDRHAQPSPIGVPGELLVAGAGVSAAAARATGDPAFVDDPFGVGRAYRTGQLAIWSADGQLELLEGRVGVTTSVPSVQ